MKNTLNVKNTIWDRIMDEYNPEAPTFEEYFNAVNSYVKENFTDNMKNIAEKDINGVAVDYLGYLQCFNDGDIDRKQFLTAKVWAAASNLYMM